MVVCHAWKGPGSFERERAEELAEMGFAVLVADVYGGQRAKDNDEAAALMNPLMEDRGGVLKDRLHASVAALQSHELVDASRCAAIGYCFGGLCVLDLARSGADLRAVVSFHGLLAGHEFGATPVASVLACHGWDDPMATPEAVVQFGAEMTKIGADWQLHGTAMPCMPSPTRPRMTLRSARSTTPPRMQDRSVPWSTSSLSVWKPTSNQFFIDLPARRCRIDPVR